MTFDLAAERTAIAAALSTVPDVTGYALRPAPLQLRAGDAWPLLGVMERADGLSFTVSWRVLVFLPQDGPGSSDWVDQHVEAIIDALEPVGFVERVEPVDLPVGDTYRYHLQFLMRSE